VIALDPVLRARWLGGTRPDPQNAGAIAYAGHAKPTCKVSVRLGHFHRHYDANGHWTATWTPDEDYVELPGITSVALEQAYDSNGLSTATIDLANVYAREVAGVIGIPYHKIERGWFSPYRAFVAPLRQKRGVVANEWEGKLARKVQILVEQGYGNLTTRTFTGLLDSANGVAKPATMKIVARDMGQVLVDEHLFGWNIDPKLRDPIVFVDRQYVHRREKSKDPAKRREAKEHRKHSIIIDDLSHIVVTMLRWAGWPRDHMRVQSCGVSLREPISFSRGQFYMDAIKQVQNVTGFSFWMSAPTPALPLGVPTFAATHAVYPNDPVEQLADDKQLTGLDWQFTDEALAAVIRVRGKDNEDVGMTLGGDKLKRVMAVYRPPWHRDLRDAGVLRHVVHTEALYRSKHRCEVAARMIAMQQALGATTANIEIPAHPGLELDDLVGLVDGATGLNTRALIARLQSTLTLGERTSWKQTIGVALMDTPEVIHTLRDLHDELRKPDDDPDVVNPHGFGMLGHFGVKYG
jgi:hypothetical protein